MNAKSLVGFHIGREKSVPTAVRAMRFTLKALELVAPPLAVRLIDKLFRTPQRTPQRASHRAFYATGINETLHIRGFDVRVYRRGQGPAVCILHGWSSMGYRMRRLADMLVATGYQVIVPDLPCHGRSSGKGSHQVEIAKVMKDLFLHYNATTPIEYLVTHSWGGTVAHLALDGMRREGLSLPLKRVVALSMPTRLSSVLGLFRRYLDLSPRLMASLENTLQQIAASDERTTDEAFPMGFDRLYEDADFDLLLIHDVDDDKVASHDSIRLMRKHDRIELVLTQGLGHHRIVNDGDVHQHILKHFSAVERSKSFWDLAA